MKISEHLDITLKLEKTLNNLGKDNLSKKLVDDLFDYSKSLNELEYSELYEHKRPALIYKEYKNALLRVKSHIQSKRSALEFNEISALIKNESTAERIEYDIHYKKLREISLAERISNSKLESSGYKYDNDSNEIKQLNDEYEIVKKKYKNEQSISSSLYEKWERKKRDLFYLLKINPMQIISQIDEIESQLLILNNIQKYSEKLLKEERLVYFIYKIFVELKLVKHIGYVDFSNQFLGNEIMTLEKEQKKDRNIAYAINCIANEFVLPEIATKWKKDMANYFELKDFEKKINPSEENKNETDKEIDNIILVSK
ncbi:hypothetical protein [uncultured Empedobacter sp.]|uniref:hypothetical protein n=1 Tax=uncultured Empedobacter sp. TaxID=410844 RepID=UPI0025D3B66A|nr:hypothetical protein [uncultured Empedobacter sp.]